MPDGQRRRRCQPRQFRKRVGAFSLSINFDSPCLLQYGTVVPRFDTAAPLITPTKKEADLSFPIDSNEQSELPYFDSQASLTTP